MCVPSECLIFIHFTVNGTEEALTPAPFFFMSPIPGAHRYCASNTYSIPRKRVSLDIFRRETGSVNLKPKQINHPNYSMRMPTTSARAWALIAASVLYPDRMHSLGYCTVHFIQRHGCRLSGSSTGVMYVCRILHRPLPHVTSDSVPRSYVLTIHTTWKGGLRYLPFHFIES